MALLCNTELFVSLIFLLCPCLRDLQLQLFLVYLIKTGGALTLGGEGGNPTLIAFADFVCENVK